MKRDIELTLEWLENLEQAVGLDALLDCLPNNWSGRGALRALLAQPSPGPWTFDAESGQIRNADGWVLATVPHAIAGDEQDLANGRVMALAPVLWQLVQDLAGALSDHHRGTTTTRPFSEPFELDRVLLDLARGVPP